MNQTFKKLRTRMAFTLIELLVVISIIGLLAALIVSGAGYATVYGRKSRVQAERQALETAINQYKGDKGYYPPDNTNNTAKSALYYELTGAIPTNNPSPGFVGVNREFLTTNNLYSLFNTFGIVNSSGDPGNPAKNYFSAAGKSTRTGSYYVSGNSGATYTVFGVPVPPGSPTVLGILATGSAVNPWNYVSSNPTNNASEFDLWMDVEWRQKTNRISNWSADPKPL
jgi:prepilin-type N-terminal cleavage/methylation domain-containing protein